MESVHEQCVQALALQLAGLRPRQINALLGTVPTPSELPLGLPSGLDLYERELQRYGGQAEAILGRCAELGIGVHPSSSASYPSALRRRLGGQCPPLLYTLGAHELLEEPRRVAVIGTRMPDGEGLAHVRRVTRELVGRGAVILSGLARGCDAEAHRTCLGVGGRGIAVVATGLDETYPREHAALQRALLRQGGLVLSEYPPGSPMGRWQFVVRDRLLATLATEVLVAQCGLESGTLHTVRFAQRYGVPCFAQQYETYSEVSGGNQWLLREGLAQPHQLLLTPS
ncbi:DNA-processing protein DprA [uncultured Porphyromonas sp.]|uniref:DNA-processing protein DprA n=1 Tax=uncultured Porphyromonas sp. TaxID=159274 RepID=UPI002625328B|nr:DNA-processing protein DprA [uncultured Porphyromonas sp.]